MDDEGGGERRRGDDKVDHAGTLSESFIETWPDLEGGRWGGRGAVLTCPIFLGSGR